MKLKVGDSVLYLHLKHQHTGIIIEIDDDVNALYRYVVHWINDQDTTENFEDIKQYRKAYLEMLNK